MPETAPKQKKTSDKSAKTTSVRTQESSQSQGIEQVVQLAQHDPTQLTTANIMQLQRSIGNRATANLLQRKPDPADRISTAPDTDIQRTDVRAKGKFFGKTNMYTQQGVSVGKIDKGTVMVVEETDNQVTISGKLKDAYEVITYSTGVKTNSKYSPMVPVYVLESDFTVLETLPEETEEDGIEEETEIGVDLGIGTVSMSDGEVEAEFPIFPGHTLKLKRSKDGDYSGEVTGEIPEQSVNPSLDVGIGAQIPLPIPGLFAEARVQGSMGLGAALGGSYTLAVSQDEQTITINAEGKGTADVNIDLMAGVGAGVANIAGVSAGFFAGGGVETEISAGLTGTLKRESGKGWKDASLELALGASGDIYGAAGAYVNVTALVFSATKKFTFKKWKFAEFEYERKGSQSIEIGKGGAPLLSAKPGLADFSFGEQEDDPEDIYANDYLTDDEVRALETQPLLGN
jgi:hypothetical protein